MQKYPSPTELMVTFIRNLRRYRANIISGMNPALININDKQIYVYIKNLSPAQLSNDNPDIWRIQLPKKKEFDGIKRSDKMFILFGYDYIRKVYTTWNPYWCKQRLNIAESCSMYSRLSLQTRVSEKLIIEKLQLQNDGDVVCIPELLLGNYINKISEYYPEESLYVPIGSSIQKRKESEESATHDVIEDGVLNLIDETTNVVVHQDDSSSLLEQIKDDPEYELDDFGKLSSLDSYIINQLLPQIKDIDFPDYESIIKQVKEYYPSEATEKMTPADWIKLFDSYPWKKGGLRIDEKSQGNASKKKTHVLRVEFSDGRILEDRNASNTYCEFINIVGPEEVNILEIYHAGVNIVSKELDEKYSSYQKDIGNGWYVLTNSTTNYKYNDIKRIIDEYDIDAEVSLVPIDDAIATTTDNSQKTSGNREKIRVRFPDGRNFKPSKVLEALIEVVKYAGAERVRSLNIICCGDNLILKNPSLRYADPSKHVGGGWLCNTCSGTRTKYEQIVTIIKSLQLDISVELLDDNKVISSYKNTFNRAPVANYIIETEETESVKAIAAEEPEKYFVTEEAEDTNETSVIQIANQSQNEIVQQLNTKSIYNIFDNRTTSYKFFWFLSIISIAKQKGNLFIPYKDIVIRMAALAWPLVFEDELSFGNIDMMSKYLSMVKKKVYIISSASSKVVEATLTQNYQSKGIDKELKPLLYNVPYRFLTPWIPYTFDTDVSKKSNSKDYKSLYALREDCIVLDEDWWKYIKEHYDELCEFSKKSFVKYLEGYNDKMKLLKLMASGFSLIK